LLTAAEVGDALGMPARQTKETDVEVSSGPYKGERMGGCMWGVGDDGMASLNMIRAGKSGRDAVNAMLDKSAGALKAQGWTEERKEFSNAVCSFATPPSGEASLPISTGCIGAANGMAVSIGTMGRKPVPIEKVKPLLDKALSRVK
ncbi:MAG TPA: hypothetical protein VFA38_07955, partial [Nitrospirales bacterium]|nr:hypothetical protein [Nitrospirales bacterium]